MTNPLTHTHTQYSLSQELDAPCIYLEYFFTPSVVVIHDVHVAHGHKRTTVHNFT